MEQNNLRQSFIEDSRGTLFVILQMLVTAPITQLDTKYSQQAEKMLEDPSTTKERVHLFFKEIYETPGIASSFVKQLVNPQYTKEY